MKKLEFKDIKTQEDYNKYVEQHPNDVHLQTFSLVGTNAQLKKFSDDMVKIGWKLTFQGHSGTWLGEPIYKIKNEGDKNGR